MPQLLEKNCRVESAASKVCRFKRKTGTVIQDRGKEKGGRAEAC